MTKIIQPSDSSGLVIPVGSGRDPKTLVAGLSTSNLVDKTSMTRPMVRIKDKDSPGGTKLINIENYHPEYHTKVSDVVNKDDKPIEIKSKINKNVSPEKMEEVEEEEVEEEEEIDLNSLGKKELEALAKENKINIPPQMKVQEIRVFLNKKLSS